MAKQAQVPLAAVIKPLARLPPEEVSQGIMKGRKGGRIRFLPGYDSGNHKGRNLGWVSIFNSFLSPGSCLKRVVGMTEKPKKLLNGNKVHRGNKQYEKRQDQLVGEEIAGLRRQLDTGASGHFHMIRSASFYFFLYAILSSHVG